MSEVEASSTPRPRPPRPPRTPDDLLLELVKAEEKIRPEAESFRMTPTTLHGPRIDHRGLPRGFRARSLADVDALADARWIVYRSKKEEARAFDLTPEGRRRARLLDALEEARTGDAADADRHPLDWNEQVAPVLAAIGRAYSRAQPGIGLDASAFLAESGRADDPALGLVFEALISEGFITPTVASDTSYLPRAFRLRERGLQATAGWPSGDTAAAALLAAI